MEHPLKNNFKRCLVGSGFLWLALIIIITGVALQLNKGFELSDESYYCLASRYPYDSQLLNSLFGLVNHRFTLGHTGLLELRVFKLLFQSLAILVFTVPFFLFLVKRQGLQSSTASLFALLTAICGYINYDYLPMTLSYNTWSLIFSLLFWSAFLSMVFHMHKPGIFIATNIGVGFSIFILGYVKTPNALLLTVIHLLYFLFFERRKLIKSLVWQLAGALSALFFLFGSFEQFITKTGELYFNVTAIKHASLQGYLGDLNLFVTQNLGYRYLLLQLLLFGFVYFIRKRRYATRAGIAAIFANGLQGYLYIKGNGIDIANDFLFGFLLCITVLQTLVLYYRKDIFRQRGRDLFIISALCLTPILMAAGTANPIVYSASHYLIFMAAGLTWLLSLLSNNELRAPALFYSFIIATCIPLTLYQGMIKAPYRQGDLHLKQEYLTFAPEFSNIAESPEAFATLKLLHDKLKQQNTEHLPVLSSPPGLGGILLAGMRPFAVFWLADDEKDAEINEAYFKLYDFRRNLPFLMISNKIKGSEIQRGVFKRHGMDLDKTYLLCDSVYSSLNNEYLYLMKPVSRNL